MINKADEVIEEIFDSLIKNIKLDRKNQLKVEISHLIVFICCIINVIK